MNAALSFLYMYWFVKSERAPSWWVTISWGSSVMGPHSARWGYSHNESYLLRCKLMFIGRLCTLMCIYHLNGLISYLINAWFKGPSMHEACRSLPNSFPCRCRSKCRQGCRWCAQLSRNPNNLGAFGSFGFVIESVMILEHFAGSPSIKGISR